jgi:alpha/beta superfamily hydrolase
MNPKTEPHRVDGPAGALQCAIDRPASVPRAVAVICHPHPQHGGTMDNKVVITLARAFAQLGALAVRFNFRGVGASEGAWDDGRGEVEDALAVIDALRAPGLPLWLGGFSFGGYVAAAAAHRLATADDPARSHRLALVAPAVRSFPTPVVPPDTLIVHGEADDIVPLAAVLDWARPQVLPLTLVPGAGHFFHGQLTLLKQIVLASFGAHAH